MIRIAMVSSLAALVALFSIAPAVADSMLCRSKVEEKIRSLKLDPAFLLRVTPCRRSHASSTSGVRGRAVEIGEMVRLWG
jgi:hypothetical protein